MFPPSMFPHCTHEGTVRAFGFNGRPYGFLSWEGKPIFFHLSEGRIPTLVDGVILWLKGQIREPIIGERISFMLSEDDPRGLRAIAWAFTSQSPRRIVPHDAIIPDNLLSGVITDFFSDRGYGFARVLHEEIFLHVDTLFVPFLQREKIFWVHSPEAASWLCPMSGHEVYLTLNPYRERCARRWVIATEQVALEYLRNTAALYS